jgi:hypothetical protein
LRVTQNSSKLGGINGSLQLANEIKSFLDRDLIGCSAPDMLGLFTSGQKQNGFQQIFELNEAVITKSV